MTAIIKRCHAQVGEDWCENEVENGVEYCDEHRDLEDPIDMFLKEITEHFEGMSTLTPDEEYLLERAEQLKTK